MKVSNKDRIREVITLRSLLEEVTKPQRSEVKDNADSLNCSGMPGCELLNEKLIAIQGFSSDNKKTQDKVRTLLKNLQGKGHLFFDDTIRNCRVRGKKGVPGKKSDAKSVFIYLAPSVTPESLQLSPEDEAKAQELKANGEAFLAKQVTSKKRDTIRDTPKRISKAIAFYKKKLSEYTKISKMTPLQTEELAEDMRKVAHFEDRLEKLKAEKEAVEIVIQEETEEMKLKKEIEILTKDRTPQGRLKLTEAWQKYHELKAAQPQPQDSFAAVSVTPTQEQLKQIRLNSLNHDHRRQTKAA